jgi:hypothetical protein
VFWENEEGPSVDIESICIYSYKFDAQGRRSLYAKDRQKFGSVFTIQKFQSDLQKDAMLRWEPRNNRSFSFDKVEVRMTANKQREGILGGSAGELTAARAMEVPAGDAAV